ncbi:OLC1v1032246C1 [Oldenlandia corymbosa var. corymbosa]|uniref:OLC1v1032246C1 n=1 Tax=Oldenlandia corymbosa var. corymbosa TaxID=529605 RepID=A0AAV1CNQ8_OLDCO|nr:OLC1v1032246C1 [Oldenlandia corymbosa var. corymbosa]
MAMGSERSTPSSSTSRPLHNFNLPGLRWGSQRFLRCKNVNSTDQASFAGGRRSSPSSHSDVFNNGNGDSNASDFGPLIGKRKERENFDEPSRPSADYRRGSEFRKSGLSSKSGYPPLPPASVNTDCGRRIRLPPAGGDDGDGIAAVREKLMIDLQTETDKIKVAIFKDGLDSEVANDNTSSPAPVAVSSSAAVTVAEAEAAADGALRPWNLRTRRAACKAPTVPNGFSAGAGTSNGNGGSSPGRAPKLELMKPVPSLSPLRPGTENLKSPRLRSVVAAGTSAAVPSNEKERAKFSVALSRHDIDEDFVAMTGRKPPRRPQKRLKHIQKTLDTLFPGLWLSEITADMYKVPETQ